MTPPNVCPTPPQAPQRDCPLYDQRLAYGPDESLRRAILIEHTAPDLAALIRAEAAPVPEQVQAEVIEVVSSLPDPPPPSHRLALPAPEPVSSSIFEQLHKEAK